MERIKVTPPGVGSQSVTGSHHGATFQQRLSPPRSGYGLSDLLEMVRRHKWFFGSVLAAGLTLTVLAALLMTKVYIGASAIVFDRNDARPYEAVEELRNQERDKSVMETELDVIKSRVFVGTVVDALDLINDPDYNTYLPQHDDENEGGISLLVNAATKFLAPKQDSEMVGSRLISTSVQRDRAITTLLASYTVDRKGDSLAMTIQARQTSPLKAAAIADAIAQHYVDWTAKLTDEATTNTIDYLRGQASELGGRIAAMERQVAAFTANRDLTFDPKDDVLKSRMALINEQFTVASADETAARSKYVEAKTQLASGNIAAVVRVVTSEPLDRLRTEQSRLERLKAQLSSKFAKNHPLVADADAELEANQRLMMEEADRIVQELGNSAEVAAVRAAKFSAEVASLQKQIQERSLAEIRRRELERDLLAEQKRYDQVVLRLGDLDPERGEHKGSAMVASYAEVPTSPAFPKPSLVIVAGAIGSLILAVVTAIIVDALDDRLYRPRDVEDILTRPNLVTVPRIKRRFGKGASSFEYVLDGPSLPFAKAMRNLCLAWRTIGRPSGGKIVMFCSPSTGEGKTTVALGMAAAATASNLRTVLVDFDPSAKGAGALLGLSVPRLVPKLADPQDICVSSTASPTYPRLDVVFANFTADDAEPLCSYLRKMYDLVIIDAPSLDAEEGAVWLAAHVDSIVIIAAAGRTTERKLVGALNRLLVNQPFILGGILNLFSVSSEAGKAPLADPHRPGLWKRLKTSFGRRATA
ncbi:polysaccharide biosynthesis tyrosine autokinase [Rhizobium sp. P32RR-XVIII]|uniref:GumC family protein n=1 Tax=Rhizobium sp. P32RR-XVIII TaxID=2726738 RepID=UPI00145739B8|nr:exopolysaccharide transport family protein [Rhizobium sp. P32RR-XVIII]NLS07801.1 polysaccharide biosynthesis tyrosine autokinase [Rhizobium sp. P32RR-XVIII]